MTIYFYQVIMYDVLVYAVVTTLKKIKVKHGADGGSRTHRTQGLSLLYMPILLHPQKFRQGYLHGRKDSTRSV